MAERHDQGVGCQRLEAPVLDFAEEQLGPLQRNVLCVASGLDFPLAATLDGRVIATRKPVEAKTTGIMGPVFGDWGDELTDAIPQLYLVQTTIQMICSEADLNHVFALIGGRGFVRYQVARDEDLCRELIERCSRWWDRHIEKGIEPTITEPIPLDVLKRIRRQPAKTIDLNGDSLAVVAEWESAKVAKSLAEKAAEAAQSNLLTLLGDAEGANLPDGRLVKYMQQTRKGYTVDETTFRVLRITKGK